MSDTDSNILDSMKRTRIKLLKQRADKATEVERMTGALMLLERLIADIESPGEPSDSDTST